VAIQTSVFKTRISLFYCKLFNGYFYLKILMHSIQNSEYKTDVISDVVFIMVGPFLQIIDVDKLILITAVFNLSSNPNSSS